MRYKKRYYKRRKSYRKRYRRRYSRRRGSSLKKPEVKYWSYNFGGSAQAIAGTVNSAATTNLYGQAQWYTDILSSINAGYLPNERVGARIAVKSIVLRINGELCVRDLTTAQNINCNTGQLRVIFSNSRGTAGTAIAGFFSGSSKDVTYSMVDRRQFGIHYDKIFTMNSGYPGYITSAGVQNVGEGLLFQRRIQIPVNKNVVIYGSGAGAYTKNDNDVYTLHLLAKIPGMVSAHLYQIFCQYMEMRVYYTDD